MAAGKIWFAGIVSLLALSLCAATANAEPLSMTFTEARANVGEDQLVEDTLFAAPATAGFEAQIDPVSGAISGGLLTVPDFSTVIDSPPGTEVTVHFHIGPIAGSFDRATGELSGTGFAGGTLTAANESCIVSTTPSPLTLSSAEGSAAHGSPEAGVPFSAGLTGPGAIAGHWTDMQANAVDDEDPGNVNVCNSVEEAISGPGGIWLQQAGDTEAPAAPQLASTDPASPSANGTPRIRGTAEAGSTVKVYSGSGCTGALVATGSAAELGSPGLTVAVAEGVTAAFSATATDAAGNTSVCSASVSYTRVKASVVVDPPLVRACIVPKLAGKTVKQAKKALKAAHCKLGKVSKPKQPKGKKRRVLVVKSSSPRQGAKPADHKVALKLRVKPKPKPKKVRRA